MDKSKINLERLRAYDAEWEEDKHPRAENGQFTSGSGSSAGGGAESANKYGYSRSEQHVANKMEEWDNEQGNIAALEAADAFRDAREDENDMREVLKSVRQHLVENENDIRGYDENPKNFDKVMEQLDDMESMLDDQDNYEFKHGEIKSPLRQAAETIQGVGKSPSDLSGKLAELKNDKSTDKQTREAISALGSDIKSALKQAHSEEGFTGGMLQDGKADKLAKKLSELTGEKYYIDTIAEKGFMGMNFTKKVLKVKE